jgi:hypothetical protein
MEAMIIMQRQQNNPNWSAKIEIYCNSYSDLLSTFQTEQVWDGSKAGHERLMSALIERLEGEADRLGLEYKLYQPEAVRGKAWAARLPRTYLVSRIPF